ncbi:SMI1/KNR4 family protein [Streptomyces huiliensis]|uniref:SMI1/KNR4 family protein n=1 Tax=Streptomyces huiliensis TaxID=2876027 RepID=UPI001CC01000|nr:SMI1/KNR4 family protein [Streptomyces huiliensis]MBZ4318230.1 SMI1/KNR4 family protein [Streptomyces huiliensis]
MTDIWAGVRERVLALRTTPEVMDRVFGAVWLDGGHRFELAPPLTEAELARAEERLNVALPADYRSFLLEVAASGAGPEYGVMPLSPLLTGPRAGETSGVTSRPFRPGAVQELLDEHEENEPRRAAYPDDETYARDRAAWDARWDALDAELTWGTLRLGHQGCGYYSLLVVTGEERGLMWEDVRAVGEGLVPLQRRGAERLTFAEWYLGWLDWAEPRIRAAMGTTSPSDGARTDVSGGA